MRTSSLLALLLLLAATTTSAATLTTEAGTLAAAQAATGVSANDVDPGANHASLWLTIVNTAGTGTLSIEQSSNGTTFGTVTFDAATTSPLTFALTSSSAISVHVDGPRGRFRANTTACSSCSVTVTYQLGPLY